MLSSLGQILRDTGRKATPDSRGYNVLPDNPVFGPLASSRFRDLQFAPGTHVIYDSELSAMAFPREEPQWWLTESGEPPDEVDPFEVSGEFWSPWRFERRNPLSVPRPGDFDPQLNAGELVNIGVADILNFLREKELRREKSGTSTNPFDEALDETSNDTAQSKDDRVTETDPPKKDDKGIDDSSSGGGSSASRNFLFIGNFSGQTLQTAKGTSDSRLLADGAAVFELTGIGKVSFDLDIVLRGKENQESVSFGLLNGDGFLDVIVTDWTTNQAYIHAGDGNGGYTPSGSIYGGHGPSMAAVADFSGDGSQDVAVMLQTDKRIAVDGKGLRKFVFLPTSDVGDGYSSMLPYDFDGDGLNDLLLTNYLSSTATVYRNQGQALFAVADTFPLQSFPFLQSSVDLNGDWMSDLVYVQYLGGHVSLVFRDASDGRISSIANTILDPSVYYALGDFDNDGVVDVALARRR